MLWLWSLGPIIVLVGAGILIEATRRARLETTRLQNERADWTSARHDDLRRRSSELRDALGHLDPVTTDDTVGGAAER